jgi:RHS repeat-associated protein
MLTDGRYTYTWDAENRLISIVPTSPVINDRKLEFAYDYMGRRVQTKRWVYPPSLQPSLEYQWRFVYDGWNVVEVLDGRDGQNNALLWQHTWGLDLSETLGGAGGIGGLLTYYSQTQSSNHASGTYWYFYDGNGNVVQGLDAGNPDALALKARYEYDPYGNLTFVDWYYPFGNTNPFRFSTKWHESSLQNSDLYYYGYRYYSPRLGRWLSRDPIEEDAGLSLYQYVASNPLGYVDPFGTDIYHVRPCHSHSYVFVHKTEIWTVTREGEPTPDDVVLGPVHVKVCPTGERCGLLWQLDPDKTAAKHIRADAQLPRRFSEIAEYPFVIGAYYANRANENIYFSYDILPYGTALNRGGGSLWGIPATICAIVAAAPSVVTREEGDLPDDWIVIQSLHQGPMADWSAFLRLEDQRRDPGWFSIFFNNCLQWADSYGPLSCGGRQPPAPAPPLDPAPWSPPRGVCCIHGPSCTGQHGR